MVNKLCIVGAGNGAIAAAADLTSRGFEVTLFAVPEHSKGLEGIKDDQTVYLERPGAEETCHIHKVTTDIEEALKDVDLIVPILPAFAQEDTAKALAPHLREGMVIYLLPGSCGGSLIFAKVFEELGVYDKVKLCEANTLPYAARKMGANRAKILLEVQEMYFAAFPAKYTQELYDLVKPLYPTIVPVTDVLECALNNGNITSHPAPVVLNAGKIEYYGKHYHYKEGITPSVARVNWAIDMERMAICKAFGYKEMDAIERNYRAGYTEKTDTLYEAYRSSKDVYMQIPGPNDLDGRYLTEDAPLSLVFCADKSGVASIVGVDTPVMDAVGVLASTLKDEDYFETGRNLKKIGLDGMTKDEVLEFLQEGY